MAGTTTIVEHPGTGPSTLARKLLEVAQELDYVEKRGHNDHHDYSYARAADVLAKAREELLSRGVIVVPETRGIQHDPVGKGVLTTVEMTYLFIDVEGCEQLSVRWTGTGYDTGGDKGLYKAYTGGFKYALMGLFMIPSGDDPEADTQTEEPVRAAAPRIPVDRAKAILDRALDLKLAGRDGSGVSYEPVLLALLQSVGCDSNKIGALTVDQAEAVEEFLKEEEADAGS